MADKKKNGLVKPERDEDVELIADLLGRYEVSDLYQNSYLSRNTISRLISRKTRYPQHMTMQGIAAAAGFEWILRRKRK